MRLYYDVRFLGMHPRYSSDIGNGPVGVAHYNNNVCEYESQNRIDKTGLYLRLQGRNTIESMDFPTSADLVCYCQP